MKLDEFKILCDIKNIRCFIINQVYFNSQILKLLTIHQFGNVKLKSLMIGDIDKLFMVIEKLYGAYCIEYKRHSEVYQCIVKVKGDFCIYMFYITDQLIETFMNRFVDDNDINRLKIEECLISLSKGIPYIQTDQKD